MHRMRRSASFVAGLSGLVAIVTLAACGAAPPAASPSSTSPPLAKTARATDGPAPASAPGSSATANAGGAERASGYDQPPQAILDVLRAPSPPRPYVDPTGATILLASWLQYPPMVRVAEPFLRLAGVRVEPKTRRKHDTSGGYGISPCARDFTLVDVARGSEVRIALPAGGCVDAPSWSADGKRLAFRSTSAEAVELWVADGKTGQAHRVGDLRVNPMLSSNTMQWMPDQKTMLVKLVPDNAGRVEGGAGHWIGADLHAPRAVPAAAPGGLRDHRSCGIPHRRRSEEGL
jgi:dipeptidyl aminopeptidase/acylaminoacyl peptidase